MPKPNSEYTDDGLLLYDERQKDINVERVIIYAVDNQVRDIEAYGTNLDQTKNVWISLHTNVHTSFEIHHDRSPLNYDGPYVPPTKINPNQIALALDQF